jgi:GTP-binding protein
MSLKAEPVRILQAEFERSLPGFELLPPPSLPEVALVGRSNVGKSSLINALCERKALARVSKTPGRTQTFNFYNITFAAGADRRSCYFVDLPGYGYAKIDKGTRRKWREMIERYLHNRPSLELVALLIDARRSPGEEEQLVADMGRQGNLLIVMTKSDKLSKNELKSSAALIGKELKLTPDRILPSSLLQGKAESMERLRRKLHELVFEQNF